MTVRSKCLYVKCSSPTYLFCQLCHAAREHLQPLALTSMTDGPGVAVAGLCWAARLDVQPEMRGLDGTRNLKGVSTKLCHEFEQYKLGFKPMHMAHMAGSAPCWAVVWLKGHVLRGCGSESTACQGITRSHQCLLCCLVRCDTTLDTQQQCMLPTMHHDTCEVHCRKAQNSAHPFL